MLRISFCIGVRFFFAARDAAGRFRLTALFTEAAARPTLRFAADAARLTFFADVRTAFFADARTFLAAFAITGLPFRSWARAASPRFPRSKSLPARKVP